jgi:integrase
MLVDREGVWYIDLVHPVTGKRVRKSTKTKDKKQAEKLHAKVQNDLFESQWDAKPKDTSMTLQQGFERCFTERWHESKSSDTVEFNYKRLCKYVDSKTQLSSITLSVVNAVLAKMKADSIAYATINRSMSVLRTVLTCARDEWELLGRIPKIPIQKEGKGRQRWLQDGEEEAITGWCRDNHQGDLADLIEVLLDTGCRLSEILKLQPKDIVWKERHVILWDTKNSEWAVQPLTDRALRILEERTRMLGSPFKGMTRASAIHRFQTMKKHCGYSDDKELCLHTMRHTTASRLVMQGVDLKRVQEFMRHHDIQTTLRYAKLNTEEKRKVAQVLN